MLNTELEVGDMITVAPQGTRTFEVLAIDPMSDDMVYAVPVYNPKDQPAQWYFTTYVERVIEQEDGGM